MSQWYYAHDGKQLGPVPISELHRLAANGEFDLEKDLVWQEGMNDWKPASTIEELKLASSSDSLMVDSSEAFGAASGEASADSLDPYAAPSSPWSEPVAVGGEGLPDINPGSEALDLGACISRAFELTKRHFSQILVIGIIMMGISLGVSMMMGAIDNLLGITPKEAPQTFGSSEFNQLMSGINNRGSLLNSIVTGLVDVFLGLGIVRVGLNIVSGQAFTINLLFSQAGKTLRAFVAQIIFGLMVGLGLLLLVVPGLYLACRFGYYKIAIVDKDMGIIEAFNYSSQLTENNKMSILGLGVLLFLIIIGGLLALVVGLIFAIPLITLAWIVSYHWLRHGHRSVQDRVIGDN